MGVFTDQIVVRVRPHDPMPFEVFQTFEFHAGEKNSGVFVRVEAGFCFNGTSIPWAFRWLINPSDFSLLQCAALHDKIFRTGTLWRMDGDSEVEFAVHRDFANALMAEAMIAREVAPWKQNLINPALAIGSGPAWRRNKDEAARTETTR